MAVSEQRATPQATGEPRPAAQHLLDGAEVLALAAALGVGLLAWAALVLANAGRFSLLAAAGLAALAGGAGAVVAWRSRPRPRLAVDRRGLAVLLGVGLVAAFLYFPGFSYGVGKDPGAYVSHAIAIARTGSTSYQDPVLDRSRIPRVEVTREDPVARFPAIWIKDRATQRVVLQFYHLWPALLAGAFQAGGHTGLVNLAPACGLLAVLLVTLAVRRAFGLLAGATAGLLLAVNMLEVWQARYPSTEIFAQLLVSGALLGVVVALRTGWRPAAGAAGLLLGLAYLTRADALLLLLLACGVGCVLIATGRFDARAGWFAAGLVITLPYGFFQAYGTARRYTLANLIPDFPIVLGAIVGALAVAVLLRRLAPGVGRWALGQLERRRVQLGLGAAVVGAAAVLLVVGFLRPALFEPVYTIVNGRRTRTFDEASLVRLSWFLTVPAFGLALGGLALIALRRWRAAAWTVVVPAVCLLPLYAYRAEVSSRLMWWTRRFVPVIVPGLVVLVAVALAAGLGFAAWPGRRRWLVRAGAALALAALLAVFAGQSLALRGHQEHGGSFETVQRIAGAAGGRQGVFLWQQASGGLNEISYLFGGPVWLQQGQISALLPRRPSPDYVRSFVRGFPGQPVFLVTAGHAAPRDYAGLGLRGVDRITYLMPIWEETYETRPSSARGVPLRFSIWQVEGGER
jgi:hypothetical protein